jgi:hypothetical protein
MDQEEDNHPVQFHRLRVDKPPNPNPAQQLEWRRDESQQLSWSEAGSPAQKKRQKGKSGFGALGTLLDGKGL